MHKSLTVFDFGNIQTADIAFVLKKTKALLLENHAKYLRAGSHMRAIVELWATC